MAARVGGADHQRGAGDLRRGERAVRRGHGGLAAQPRVVPGQERGLPGFRDDEPLVGEGEVLQLRGHRMGEPGEPEPGELAVARLPAVGVDDAMALGADEPQRDGVRAVAGLDHRGDEQRGAVGRDVEAQFRRARRRHGALLAPVDEGEADRVRLLEDGPELAGLAGGQVQVLLVAVAGGGVRVVVTGVLGLRAGPVEGVELVQQPDVRGGELVAQQQVVEPGPGQVAGDPAAKPPRLHQPGLELELAGGVLGGRLVAPVVRGVAGVAEGLRRVLHQGQLDRQRRVRGDVAGRGRVAGLRVGEQRVERLLPGQRGPAGRDPGRGGRGQQRLVGRGEHEGGDVDAVGALGAAAVALAKAQREPRGRAERGGHRPDLPGPASRRCSRGRCR